MGDKTGIQWTDATWNPTTGCDRISPGCTNCYALDQAAHLQRQERGRMRIAAAAGKPELVVKYQNDGDPRTSGPGFKLTLHPHTLEQPLRWRKPRRIFVNSMSDLFHKDVPDEFIDRVFDVMGQANQHTFQVLTKRPARMLAYVSGRTWKWAEYAAKFDDCPTEPMRSSPAAVCASIWPGEPVPPNVWLGTSIENDNYSFRANHLRNVPASVRFVSCEPLIGPLPRLNLEGIQWAIVGGESGPNARPMQLEWVDEIAEKATAAGCALFVKQLGVVWSEQAGHGRTHGGDWDLWPEHLRVREWPA